MIRFLLIAASAAALAIPEQKSCTEPRARGDFCDGQGQKQMFYYNSLQGICQPFMYNGCNGNGNRFATKDECMEYCRDGGQQLQQDDSTSQAQLAQSMKKACNAEYATDHLNITQCSRPNDCDSNSSCTGGFCCPNSSYICNLNYDTGKFAVGGEKSDRYFWTDEFNTCMRFSFYGTLGNANNFPNYFACMRTCGNQN